MATYKLTDKDITLMIKLRATNDAIFTGRRNSALRAWRAIGKEMGLQGKVTTIRLKKKWENFKDKYKELKNSSVGDENKAKPVSWRWFHLMDQAMTGRLAGSAHILNPSLFDMDDDEEAAMPDKKLCLRPEAAEGNIFGMNIFEAEGTSHDDAAATTDAAVDKTHQTAVGCERALKEEARTLAESDGAGEDAALLYATIVSNGDGAAAGNPYLVVNDPGLSAIDARRNVASETAELDHQIAELEKERQTLEREQAEFDRERLLLERERELLSRELASVERDRVTLDNERAAMDRERAALDRDRAVLDRDRALIEKDRAELLREREATRHCKLYQSNGCPAAELDPERLERRERLISLFERFIEKL